MQDRHTPANPAPEIAGNVARVPRSLHAAAICATLFV